MYFIIVCTYNSIMCAHGWLFRWPWLTLGPVQCLCIFFSPRKLLELRYPKRVGVYTVYIVLLRRSAPEFVRVSAASIITTPAYSSGFPRVHCCIIIYYNKYNDGWCVRRNSTDVKKYYHRCQTKWKGSSLRML